MPLSAEVAIQGLMISIIIISVEIECSLTLKNFAGIRTAIVLCFFVSLRKYFLLIEIEFSLLTDGNDIKILF